MLIIKDEGIKNKLVSENVGKLIYGYSAKSFFNECVKEIKIMKMKNEKRMYGSRMNTGEIRMKRE